MHTGTRTLALALCVLCSCSLYDEGRAGSAHAVDAPDPSSNVAGEGLSEGSGVGEPHASPEPERTSCDPERDCFWWHNQAGCRAASVPTSDERPSALQSEPDVPAFVLGWTQIKLSGTPPDQPSSAPATFGLDIDRDCTEAPGCGGTSRGSCRPRLSSVTARDGEACRDNTYANLWQVASLLPLLGKQLGLSEAQLNCGLRRGSYNMLLRVSGYNGRPNDPEVRVDFYQSPGLAKPPSWSCTDGVELEKMPMWGGSSDFRVAQGDLLRQMPSNGALPESKFSDAHAYVREGYLVSRFPDNAALRLAGDGKPFRGLHLPLSGGVWLGRLSQPDGIHWQLRDGMLVGRASIADVTRSWNESGLCADVGFDMFYQTLLTFAEERADVLANGQHDPATACDALSVGIPFEAVQVQVSGSAPLEPLVQCCKPGATSEECQADCGDGKVSGPESCDTAIAGSCPKTCTSTDPCKSAVLQGSGCTAHCFLEPITRLLSGDGCCPRDASPAQDSDCKTSVCGNNVLDPGETCDPQESCPECPSYNACLTLTRSGDRATCSVACSHEATRGCSHGDGCCPEGCERSQDSDCSDRCGDGVVQPELGESCENGSEKPCLGSCDDKDPCTEDIATGSAATCNRACSHIPILQPISGDGCCPSGIHANANSDSDCDPECGNGLIEPGEGCDDGNRNDVDSCSSQCQPIDQLDMCLTKVGARDACTECVCKKCQAESVRCYAGSRPDQNDLCTAAARCFRKHRCMGADCYCGSDILGCEANPSGPCRREIEAAAQTETASIISVRSLDTNFPIGRANAIGQCAWRSCSEFCGQ